MSNDLLHPAHSPGGDADSEVLGMARGGGLNLLAAVVSQASGLGITVVLVRLFGTADVGLYAQASAFLILLGLLSLSGFRAGLTRFVAVHLAEGDRAAVHGTVRLGVGISTGVAVLLGALLVVFSPDLVSIAFHDQRLAEPLRWVGVALPAATYIDAALSATQGWRTMRAYALIGMVFEPLLRVLLTLGLVLAGLNLRGAMIALVISNYVGAALAYRALRGLLGPKPAALSYRMKELFSFSTVSWFASMASSGLVWADVILLGVFLESSQVGIYNVATRLVMLATFVATPISASFAPRIANLHHRGEMESLGRVYEAATSWILRLSLPAFVALLAFSDDLLRLFGKVYVAGATVTVLLAIGKMVDSATGPCGVMLNQSGRPGLSMIDNVGALVLNIGLNLWLIPRYGIRGAAVAWAVSLVIVNVARVLQVRFIMGLIPFGVSAIKGLAAGAASYGVGIGVRSAIDGFGGFALALGCAFAVYLALVLALGLSAEDRIVGADLGRRLSGKRRGRDTVL